MIRPLICSPSPRDIPEVKEAMDQIKCDKVFAKYYDEPTAYKMLRDAFLRNKEYTHMVIAPDDLVITQKHFEMMLQNTNDYNLQVMSGICNFNMLEVGRDKYPCYQIGIPVEGVRGNYMTDADLDGLAGNILQMAFEGFAFCWIRRDVVEKIEFSGIIWDNGTIHAFDFGFARDCAINRIPIYIDKRVKMLHLGQRLGKDTMEDWGLGKYPSEMRFISNSS